MEIRTFISITMTNEIKTTLSKMQTELKKAEADVKWVAPQGMHLTLKFLGNIMIGQLESVCQMVLEATSNFNHFQLSLSSVGGFPNLSNPKIIWVGVDKGKEECIQLSKQIDDNLNRLGFPVETKEFFPHLTLGRVKSPRGRNELLKLIAELKTKSFGQMSVTKVEVMGSQLTPKGSIYTTLRELELIKN
ncbi:MAG: RNA 2',3'-cyclic phosphodiesterase [bacterium]|nr:RNA 2',3'-cyclic phosphodiesterase [bacterium]